MLRYQKYLLGDGLRYIQNWTRYNWYKINLHIQKSLSLECTTLWNSTWKENFSYIFLQNYPPLQIISSDLPHCKFKIYIKKKISQTSPPDLQHNRFSIFISSFSIFYIPHPDFKTKSLHFIYSSLWKLHDIFGQYLLESIWKLYLLGKDIHPHMFCWQTGVRIDISLYKSILQIYQSHPQWLPINLFRWSNGLLINHKMSYIFFYNILILFYYHIVTNGVGDI